jgi:preprotein translocase subunit SecE
MSTKTTSNTSDKLKWLSVVLLLTIGIVSFYTLTEYSLLLRVVSLLVIVGIVAVIAFSTTKGQKTKTFIRETNIEVRKVVWPTRQETIQMTGIVIVMVIILALFIWAVDSLLWWIVQYLTGQGG